MGALSNSYLVQSAQSRNLPTLNIDALLHHLNHILPTPTQRNAQKVKLANKPVTTVSIVRDIASTSRPVLQRTMLNHTAGDRPLQCICARLNCEVGQRNLKAVTRAQVRQTEVAGAHAFGGDLQLVVAAVVAFLPLQFFIVADQEGGLVVGFDERGVGAEGRVGGDGLGCDCQFCGVCLAGSLRWLLPTCTSKFCAQRSSACGRVVFGVIEPDEI